MRRKTLIALVALMSLLATSNVALAHGGHGDDTEKRGHSAEQRRELQRVRRATSRFHSVKAAERAGYEEFLECFDSDEGGMGQHYVDLSALDGTVEATHPEAMVYEVKRNGRLGLVAVEYIVPSLVGRSISTPLSTYGCSTPGSGSGTRRERSPIGTPGFEPARRLEPSSRGWSLGHVDGRSSGWARAPAVSVESV
jgi:hypothetical protein